MYYFTKAEERKRCSWKSFCTNYMKKSECNELSPDLTPIESDLYMAGKIILVDVDCKHFRPYLGKDTQYEREDLQVPCP